MEVSNNTNKKQLVDNLKMNDTSFDQQKITKWQMKTQTIKSWWSNSWWTIAQKWQSITQAIKPSTWGYWS